MWVDRAELSRCRLIEEKRVGKKKSGNLLVAGENLAVLSALRKRFRGKVGLVYVDPPFGTGRRFPGYDDRLGKGPWLSMMECRLRLLWEMLRPGGALYVHLDSKASHYTKVLLDEIAEEGSFQREIVWRIGWVSGFKSRARNYVRNHDTILYYAKGKPAVFHKTYLPYPEGYERRGGGKGRGYPLEDTWNCSDFDRLDSIQIKSFSKEKTGFPTQKNEALLDRIIRSSSNPGDLVLDAFAGSGTTLIVASRLDRRWVGIELPANVRRYVVPRLRKAGAGYTLCSV